MRFTDPYKNVILHKAKILIHTKKLIVTIFRYYYESRMSWIGFYKSIIKCNRYLVYKNDVSSLRTFRHLLHLGKKNGQKKMNAEHFFFRNIQMRR